MNHLWLGIFLLWGTSVAQAETLKERTAELVSTTNQQTQLLELQTYVHYRMQLSDSLRFGSQSGIDAVYAMSPLERLDSGEGGFCDQMVDVLMQMANTLGIPTRMVWLYLTPTQNSVHTIAEAKLGERWVVLEPFYNLRFLNSDRKLASRAEMLADPDIFIRATAGLADERWRDPAWRKLYTSEGLSEIVKTLDNP